MSMRGQQRTGMRRTSFFFTSPRKSGARERIEYAAAPGLSSEQLRDGTAIPRILEPCHLPHRSTNAPHIRPARLRPRLSRSRAHARAEHDLSDLALDHAGA